MGKYTDWNKRKEEAMKELPYIKFAFGKEQIAKVFSDWGLKYPDDIDKVDSFYGAGDIILKEDVPKYKQWYKDTNEKLDKEFDESMKDKEFVKDMFIYELGNHEWQISGDDWDTLDACGLSEEEVENDDFLREIWAESKKEYWKMCVENDWF